MRPARIERKEFERRLYGMSHCTYSEHGGAVSALVGNADDEDGDNGAESVDGYEADGDGADDPDGGEDGPDRDDGGDDGAGGGAGAVRATAKEKSDLALEREFLNGTMVLHNYYSIVRPVWSSTCFDDDEDEVIFQLIGKETRVVAVPVFYATGESSSKGLFTVGVQKMEVKREVCAVGYSSVVDAFAVEEPSDLDIIDLLGVREDFRDSVRCWVAGASDVEGCTGLSSPTPLRYNDTLMKASTPVLCLIDALKADKYVFVNETVTHDSTCAKVVDMRRRSMKRYYFQCLLCHRDLVDRGAKPFRSNLGQAFYALLLQRPADADPSVPASTHKQRLKTLELIGKDAPSELLNRKVEPPRPAPPIEKACSEVGGGDDEGNVEELGSIGSSGSESSSSSSSSPSDKAPAVAGDSGDALRFPATILGQKVHHEHHKTQAGERTGAGLRVWCNNPAHDAANCSKFRSLHMDQDVHGDQAAVFYLAAWLQSSGELDGKAHKAQRPGRHDVQAFIDTYGDIVS